MAAVQKIRRSDAQTLRRLKLPQTANREAQAIHLQNTYLYAPSISICTSPVAPHPVSTHTAYRAVRDDDNDDNLDSGPDANNVRSPRFTTTTSTPFRNPSPSRDDATTADPVDSNSIPLNNLEPAASNTPSRRPDNTPSPREAPGQPTRTSSPEAKGSKPLVSSSMAFLTKNIWPKDGRNRSHVPAMPVWIAVVRIAQLVLAIATLGITVYGLTTMQMATGYRRITSFSGTEGFPFSWFAFAWTFSYLTWLGVAVMFIPVMYNCWVHLGLELLTVVFWLITMALLASHADDLDSLDAFIVTFGPKYEVYYKMNVEPFADGFVGATFAGTATSVINFVLFIITITVFGALLLLWTRHLADCPDGMQNFQLTMAGRALHALRKANLEKAPSTTDSQKTIQAEGDKMVASPQMTSAVPTYIHWNTQYPPPQHPHAYAYYGQPYAQSPHSQTNTSPPNSVPPHGFQPAYFPNSQWPPQPPQQQPPPEGGVWPAQNYGMYQQQVPIGPQHTGQSGSSMGSPQFPMVQPMPASKADLPGVYPTPPPGSATVGPGYPSQQSPPPPPPQPGTVYSPVELNDGRGDENMPAELPNNPPRSPR
ncbi:hypothetical protein CORC01_00542 [Colletotrichum orchidophilum]|uniref:MARVEL domain-containing protein n=1 Tax=Colletotrichum orchidophilum TaxID=1209926 RepID=A0A1G4BS62_9PEZI|nr:uncharacterized protein CORC01_00542 [Colletotrichum orchidophilum]OHF04203.1 hypothetical protein CORC01_00542 [Colletotrichum orchidophilum]